MSIAVLLSSFKVCTSANESQSLGDGTDIVLANRKSQCRRDGDECANDEVWRVAA